MKKHIYILGINFSDHDRSACLLKDGRISCAIANERLDRRRYSSGLLQADPTDNVELPMRAIVYCLRKEKIELDKIDLIVVGRSIHSPLSQARQKIPIVDYKKIIEIPFPGHHLSHALSAYYCSPFNKSAVLVVDQMGSHIQKNPKIYEKHSIYYCAGTDIKVVNKYFGTDDDLSLGLFYDYFTNGFEFVKSRSLWGNAGKLMGLSAYGKKTDSFLELIKTNQGNTIILKNNIYRFFKKIGLEINNNKLNLNGCVGGIIFKMQSSTEVGRNLAYKAQEELEQALLRIVDYTYQKTRCENLCLAGGVALNCVAIGKIIKHSRFKNVFVQPGGMDDGTSIGLAFFGWNHIYKKQKRFVLKNAYLGIAYDWPDLLACLKEEPFSFLKKYFKKQKNMSCLVASLIAKGRIVGWFQGGSEFGPRALGHRSIIADPRVEAFKEILNNKKGRETFRPFAASVLLEACNEYFDLDIPSPFMLFAAKAKNDQKHKIPAVVHVDGTTRIQTVTKEDNDNLYYLIREFQKITGIPLVLNTSFNAKDEPLVETPKDALRSFFKMELDCLVINDYILERERIPEHRIQEIAKAINCDLTKICTFKKNLNNAENISNYTDKELKQMVDLKLLRAEYYTNMQLYLKAIQEYQEVVTQNPDMPKIKNGDIFVSLGKIYLSLGQPKKAINEFKKKEELEPKNTQIKMLLAHCYNALGQTERLNKSIDAVVKEFKSK